jgi:hypothetical protein
MSWNEAGRAELSGVAAALCWQHVAASNARRPAACLDTAWGGCRSAVDSTQLERHCALPCSAWALRSTGAGIIGGIDECGHGATVAAAAAAAAVVVSLAESSKKRH